MMAARFARSNSLNRAFVASFTTDSFKSRGLRWLSLLKLDLVGAVEENAARLVNEKHALEAMTVLVVRRRPKPPLNTSLIDMTLLFEVLFNKE